MTAPPLSVPAMSPVSDISGPIDPTTLQGLVRQNAPIHLIDVRTEAEFESGHIATSHNVPLGTMDRYGSQLIAIDAPLVLVCKSGARAQQAQSQLAALGDCCTIAVLDGGLDAWSSCGGPVTDGSRSTWAMDRQVRLVAGSITLLGIGASIVAPRAKWIAGAIGGGLTFSALSDTCAMGNVLARLPYNQGTKPADVDAVMEQLRSAGPQPADA